MSQNTPKVSVILCTYNRPDHLGQAVSSVVRQTMTSWELLVINDGGADVGPIIVKFPDPRIHYYNRRENRGKSDCCNFALNQAKGEYIAYIDDDDQWAPHHLETLTQALDGAPEYGAAYSDLYRIPFIGGKDGGPRVPVGKNVWGARDFIRELNFHVNLVPHVSLLHRKDQALRANGYNPDVKALIDWNISRKLSYYCDFLHVRRITGEFWAPLDAATSQRISDVQRRDSDKFKSNSRKIKADNPPRPWPKIIVVSVVYVWTGAPCDQDMVYELLDNLFYPVNLIIVNSTGKPESGLLLHEMNLPPNIVIINSTQKLSRSDAFKLGIESSSAAFVLLASADMARPLYSYILKPLEILSKKPGLHSRAVFVQSWDKTRAEDKSLFASRDLLLQDAPNIEKIKIKDPIPETLAFDAVINEAMTAFENQEWLKAASRLDEARKLIEPERLPVHFLHRFVLVCYRTGQFKKALDECRYWLSQGYGGDIWIDSGLLLLAVGEFRQAGECFDRGLLEIGFQPLEEPIPDNLKKIFPLTPLFQALIGLARCLTELGQPEKSAGILSQAARILPDDYRVHREFGRLFLLAGQYEKSESALTTAVQAGADDSETFRLLGELCDRLGRTGDAFSFYKHALERGGETRRALESCYKTGLALNRIDDVRDVLTAFIKNNPGRYRALELLQSLPQ